LGVEKVDLDTLFRRADFITLHTPLTDQTRGIINAKAIAKMKKGVRIINCARGGLVVEKDLKAALDSGRVAGAALDVFEEEPAKQNVLFGHPKIVATPHLGASTSEAQENVALQVAEQMSDYLLTGAVMNAVNMPSISAEEAPRLRPYVRLAEQLGLFAGQLVESGMSEIEIQYAGAVGELNTKALTAAALAGLMRHILAEVNMVNAPVVAKERGIRVKDSRQSAHGAYESYMLLRVGTNGQSVSVAGTVFSDGKPRIVQVKGIDMEAEVSPHMIYVLNVDRPGLIGRVGMLLADENVNIASLHLGRVSPGSEAVALISVDGDISPALLERVRAIPNVMQAKALSF
jgi:D-3-phosphoglycerate dehydrogenase